MLIYLVNKMCMIEEINCENSTKYAGLANFTKKNKCAILHLVKRNDWQRGRRI